MIHLLCTKLKCIIIIRSIYAISEHIIVIMSSRSGQFYINLVDSSYRDWEIISQILPPIRLEYLPLECLLAHLVLAMDPEHRFGSGHESGLEPNRQQILNLGRQYTRTVNSSTVQWSAPNPSSLGWLSAGCAAGLSVQSYNGLAFGVR